MPPAKAVSGPSETVPAVGEPPAGGAAVWLDSDGRPLPFSSDAELLDFLATARVVESSPIGIGVTQPDRLLLERDGVRAHAVFHDVHVANTRARLHGKTVLFFRDSYTNNVAAYKLSRLLGIRNVPPAVVRRVHRAKGSVTMWIEGTVDETERRHRRVQLPEASNLAGLDMWIFDNLINNIDRTQENFLYDRDWNIWYIDHTRAFGAASRTLPHPERVKRCSRRLLEAVRRLDLAQLTPVLAPLMGKLEIRAVLHRRDLLLELIDQKIAERGEERVLFDHPD